MDSQHARYEDDVGAYLLEALSAEEARSFEQHLAACEVCRLELARLRSATEALPRSVDAVEPPVSLKRSLMRSVRREAAARSRAERRRVLRSPRLGVQWRLLPLAAAALLLVVGVAIGYGVRGGQGGGARLVTGQVDRSRLPNASARLVVPTGGHAGALLQVSGLPSPPSGYIYELWLRRGAEFVPASLFSVRADGRGAAAIAQSLAGTSAVLVTREHAGGAPAPTGPALIRVRT